MKPIPLLLAALVLCGCEKATEPEPKYFTGDMVESVIDGRRGQVVGGYIGGDYLVRFGAHESIYKCHRMAEFELRAAK